MRTLSGIVLFLTLLILFSCEEQGWFVICDDCISSEPSKTNISGKVETSDFPVEIRVYEGELENNDLYASLQVTDADFDVNVSLNKKYTVTATYQINGDTYIAVDSAYPRVKYTDEQCEDPCYFVYDRTVNLRIKYLAGRE